MPALRAVPLLALSLAALALAQSAPPSSSLDLVVAAKQQTGSLAVAPDGRIFVSVARLPRTDGFSVGLVSKGALVPYPGGAWNLWKPGLPPAEHFISVTDLRIEPNDPRSFWILDSAPGISGGPKLIQLDLRTNKVARVFPLPADVAPAGSAINHVRLGRSHAFIPDSAAGALIVLDLYTGRARRLLFAGPKSNAVGAIELSPDHSNLYFCSPTGGPLRRIGLDDLLNEKLDAATLNSRVKDVGPLLPAGSLLMLSNGDLLFSDTPHHAISRLTADGKTTILRQSKMLEAPGAMAVGPDGKVYVVGAPTRVLSFAPPN